MYYVYLLRCRDGSLYTGITTDLSRRFKEHQGHDGKGAKYTASHSALMMEAAWTAENRSQASKLEYRMKRLTKCEKEQLILGEVPLCLELEPDRRCSVPVIVEA